MATLRTIYKPRTGKENGKWVNKEDGFLFVQYSHNGKTALFSTNYAVTENNVNWTKDKRGNNIPDPDNPIRRNYPGYSTKNANVRKLKNKIGDIVDKLVNQEIEPDINTVKEKFNLKPTKVKEATLSERWQEFTKAPSIHGKNKGKFRSHGTRRQLKAIFNNLLAYLKESNQRPTYNVFTLSFYDKYLAYMDEKGKSVNTIGNQVKFIKAFLAWSEKNGYFKPDFSLSDYSVTKEIKPIIYLTRAELDTLYGHNFKSKRLSKVRDLFVFQCSTGLRFSDLSRLGRQHIVNNEIVMKSQKTKTDIFVPLSPRALEILNKYDYELPLISEQKYNDYIKEAVKTAKIKTKVEIRTDKDGKTIYKNVFKHELVSSHTAVKTFISHCVELGIRVKDVAIMTGKTEKVLLDHYYGTDREQIRKSMQVFDAPTMKVS